MSLGWAFGFPCCQLVLKCKFIQIFVFCAMPSLAFRVALLFLMVNQLTFAQGILPQWMRRAEVSHPPLVAGVSITDPDENGYIEIIGTTNKNKIVSFMLNEQELGGFSGEIVKHRRKLVKGKNILAFTLVDEYKQKVQKEYRVDFGTDKSIKPYKKPNMIALVLGVADYKFSPLLNPLNDANAIAAKLNELGYKSIVSINGTRREILSKIIEFGELSKRYDVAMVFYAGHGVQIEGKNFIIPSDFDLRSSKGDVASMAINMAEVISDYVASPTKLLILDACRDNPFIGSFIKGRGMKFERGLAAMELNESQEKAATGSNGTLISFSTKDGNVAIDGEGKHSPYTESLLKFIGDPVDINIVFRRVRQDVMKKTQGNQIPWEYGSLVGDELVIGVK